MLSLFPLLIGRPVICINDQMHVIETTAQDPTNKPIGWSLEAEKAIVCRWRAPCTKLHLCEITIYQDVVEQLRGVQVGVHTVSHESVSECYIIPSLPVSGCMTLLVDVSEAGGTTSRCQHHPPSTY